MLGGGKALPGTPRAAAGTGAAQGQERATAAPGCTPSNSSTSASLRGDQRNSCAGWGLMGTQHEWGDFQLVFELPSHTEQTSQHSGSAVAPHVRGVCSWFLSQKVPIQAFCGA